MITLDALNPEQRTVVERVNGPLLVLAGAGSGKTRTLTYRIAHILDQGMASPHGILAITFTRKAAWELRRRLEELVGTASADITAVTFHSLGYKILCAESAALGYKADALAISDGSEARRLLKRAMKETGVDGTRWDVEQVAGIIDKAKDNLYGPDAFVRVKGDFFEESIAKVYTRYQQLLKENNAVDYGDLIRLSVQLLRANQQTLGFYQQMFRYVSVDEFQDTSFGQYQLIRLLVWAAPQPLLCRLARASDLLVARRRYREHAAPLSGGLCPGSESGPARQLPEHAENPQRLPASGA